MNAKFIFWQNIEFIKNDYNYGKLSYEEREAISAIVKRNTTNQVPYAEDSKTIKRIVEVINDRTQQLKRQRDGIYRS